MLKKNILITGCYHSLNSGVMAMAEVIIQNFPDRRVYILSSDNYYNQDKERYSIYKNVQLINSEWLKLNSIMNKLKLFLGLLGFSLYKNFNKKIKDIDIIIDISGDSISNDYGTKSILFSIFPILIATHRKKIIFAPQTLGPFQPGLQTFYVKKIFKKSYGIFLREEFSLKYIKKINVKEHSVCADLAFLLNSSKNPYVLKSNKKVIGVGVSSLIKKFGISDPILLFKEICDICLRKNYQVILITHVTTIHGNDIIIAQKIKEQFFAKNEDVLFLNRNFRASEWKDIIGRCDAIISARMHPVILALSQNIPSLNLSYNHKSIGVIHDRFYPYGQVIDVSDKDVLAGVKDFLNQILTLKSDKMFVERTNQNKMLAKKFIDFVRNL